ncbi:unnamed protein product [Didymodactylos carnosus]|uniref:Uncharacterized protein n=1 Tax=Didymodactylos carnosus TaxID=1234261 RepID=A0A813TDY0_9BILA|nr:unnamed protein product [Didymodactylos carnosus]CAF0910081.1 unnamed protein product [Didymodactylos carnosus]CAF3593506.1 unnamed protein product [Didymodactylos carnosus]CAF3689219.1 unnamed protein product [Didymodactylos carnosus]
MASDMATDWFQPKVSYEEKVRFCAELLKSVGKNSPSHKLRLPTQFKQQKIPKSTDEDIGQGKSGNRRKSPSRSRVFEDQNFKLKDEQKSSWKSLETRSSQAKELLSAQPADSFSRTKQPQKNNQTSHTSLRKKIEASPTASASRHSASEQLMKTTAQDGSETSFYQPSKMSLIKTKTQSPTRSLQKAKRRQGDCSKLLGNEDTSQVVPLPVVVTKRRAFAYAVREAICVLHKENSQATYDNILEYILARFDDLGTNEEAVIRKINFTLKMGTVYGKLTYDGKVYGIGHGVLKLMSESKNGRNTTQNCSLERTTKRKDKQYFSDTTESFEPQTIKSRSSQSIFSNFDKQSR